MSDQPNSKPPSMASKSLEIFTFDEGLIQVRQRVDQIFQTQNVIAVAVNGSNPNIGKTRLATWLSDSLFESKIPVGTCDNPTLLDSARAQVYADQEGFNEWRLQVYILSAWDVPHGVSSHNGVDIRKDRDIQLSGRASASGIPIKKVDLWVGICSEEYPFEMPPAWKYEPYDPFEDVLIRNENAKDKSQY